MNFTKLIRVVVASIALIAVAGVWTANAVPVYPGSVKVQQKDGTTITVRLYGDERFNYATTTDGYHLVSKDGIYYYATIKGAQMVSTGIKARDPMQRGAEDRKVLQSVQQGYPYAVASAAELREMSSAVTFGASGVEVGNEAYINKMRSARSEGDTFRSLVILVQFDDLPFSVSNPQHAFDRLLNEAGYSDNGGTGSARDYYVDNSNGKFNPHFDVVGPFTLPRSFSYYADVTKLEREFVPDVCNLAEQNGVDFSQYIDDGILRDVFIFYSGYNNAEVGGGTYIHPARLAVKYDTEELGVWGGGRLLAAAFTSELKGASGTNMAGIGTFCHEFGHILGWPDLYDSDYNVNGTGFNLDIFSLMASGSYVNAGRTPPAISAYERYMVKWADLPEITEAGDYTLEPVYGNKAFMMKSANDGEFFVFEYRNGTINKWDKFLAEGNNVSGTGYPTIGSGSGMLVYHIDRSNNVVGGRRASSLWNFTVNRVNAYGDHECMGFLMASRVQRTNGYLRNFGKMFFPGSDNVTQLTAKDYPYFVAWDGNTIGWELYNIKENGTSSVTFEVKKVDGGVIKDFTVEPGQFDVTVSFFSPYNEKYDINCEEVGGSAKFTKNTDDRTVNFSGLKPGTKYLVTLVADGSTDVIKSFEVTTGMPDPDKVPVLAASQSYNVGQYLVLSYRNITSNVKSVKWTFDGDVCSETAFKIADKESGYYEVRAEITTDAGVEYLIKYIKVN